MQNQQNTPFTRFHGDDTGSNPVGDANKFDNLAIRTRRLGLEESSIIELASNDNPVGMPTSTRIAIERALDDSVILPDADVFARKKTIARCLEVPTNWITVYHGSNDC